MKPLIQLKTTTPLVFLPLVLICFALLPRAQAVTPAPDGGYPGFNTAEGLNALLPAIPGVWNTAIGGYALSSSAPGGIGNTAVGLNALRHNTTGTFNIAVGVNALLFNSIGSQNIAIGYQALDLNTTGTHNTGVGFQALFANKANDNTAVGWRALLKNNTGTRNVAIGFQALMNNTDMTDNTATGHQALNLNATGNFNTANGSFALSLNTDGFGNTAIGASALGANMTGDNNTAVGFAALANNSAGQGNIALGNNAGILTNGIFNIDIGNNGVGGENQTIRIGNALHTRAFIAGIRGKTTGVADAIAVLIDSAGQLGTLSSSRRFKKEIKPMDQTSEAILGLKPVTFHYKSDASGTPQFGLIAEEVAEVDPNLVVRDENGEIYTVRYEAVNAMLLNEFLKEHRKVAEQETAMTQLKATVAQQQRDFQSRLAQQQKDFQVTTAEQKKDFESKIAHQQKQIEALTTGLQKVSDQLELSKPAPQLAVNDQ